MRRHVYAWLVATIIAIYPAVGVAGEKEDQQIADHIHKQLVAAKESGALKDFTLSFDVKNGEVTFSGQVASEADKKTVFSAAHSAIPLGASKIKDGLTVSSKGTSEKFAVQQTSATEEAVVGSSRRSEQPAIAPQPFVPAVQRTQGALPLAAAPAQSVAYRQQGAGVNYMPASSPAAMGARHDQPNMPNYAWPGYAAYPNYGAVNYPQQYSPTAWPYIGPFYPYPQVPLGWRKVTMEWDDGWWYLDFNDR